MEEQIIAYVLINTEVAKEHEVAEAVKKEFKDNVEDVRVTYGQFDVVVKVKASSLREIDKIITKMRSLKGVLTSLTLIGT
ncbi:MAG: Lrp/AsnC ligand binding domain-containing protein [Desulfurococcales archaeon]|nr:Lrp/AsnC ligand binding domain-containing protein [Desulfurococcales archaeon]